MTTHFITAEVDLQASPVELNRAIEAELHKRGEPLRWSITDVDTEKQTVRVEAVVTTDAAAEDISVVNVAAVDAGEIAAGAVSGRQSGVASSV